MAQHGRADLPRGFRRARVRLQGTHVRCRLERRRRLFDRGLRERRVLEEFHRQHGEGRCAARRLHAAVLGDVRREHPEAPLQPPKKCGPTRERPRIRSAKPVRERVRGRLRLLFGHREAAWGSASRACSEHGAGMSDRLRLRDVTVRLRARRKSGARASEVERVLDIVVRWPPWGWRRRHRSRRPPSRRLARRQDRRGAARLHPR